MIRKIIPLAVVYLVFANCGKSPEELSQIRFFNDLYSAKTYAAEKNQPLIIEFFSKDCPWSKMMADSTFSNKIVIGMSSDMVFARIDADEDSLDAREYNVSFYPTFIVAKPDAKEIDRLVGYYPPADFYNEVQLYLQGNETLEDYQGRLADEPSRVDYHLVLGEKYKYRSNWDKALEFYNNVLRLAGENNLYEREMAMIGMADVYCEQEEYENAAKAYEEFLNTFPESEKAEDAARKLPFCLAQLGNFDEAKVLFEKYLSDYPQGVYVDWVKDKLDDLNRLVEAGK
jgi:tetratricopeptide (TPR) repeat protein